MPPNLSEVHFRKFLNKKILLEVLDKCELKKISVSRSAFSRCNSDCLEIIKKKEIEIVITNELGRPNSIGEIIEFKGGNAIIFR